MAMFSLFLFQTLAQCFVADFLFFVLISYTYFTLLNTVASVVSYLTKDILLSKGIKQFIAS